LDREREKGIKRPKKNKQQREREALEAEYAGREPTFCFVKRHIRQGVLPNLLETLLKTRSNVKGMMEEVDKAVDALLYAVLDGRQLALKVVCNSVYGFLKAFILTDKDLMSAVTSYGRNMIYTVNNVIKQEFQNVRVVDVPACRKANIDPEVEPAAGEPDPRPYTYTNAYVVYGDTDSVMVCFGDVTLADCARLGAAAAKRCTELFEKPNKLAFEAVKLRSIFLNKKRYCALEIEKIIPGERMDDAIKRAKVSLKGLEGKRESLFVFFFSKQNNRKTS
jgi:DNA polymerase delta subunit 1